MTLYISDLDGTLLNSKAELSPASRDLLAEMIGDGLSFTVASARSVSSIKQMLEGLKLSLPVIEFNGAFISNLETGGHEFINAIDSTLIGDLYNLMSGTVCKPFVATYNGAEDCLYYPAPTNDGAQWYLEDRKSKKDPRLRSSEDLGAQLKEQVICLTSIGKEEALTDLAAQIHAVFGTKLELHLFHNQYSPGWYWLTAHDYKATKDRAIRSLINAYGLTDKKLVVFGDQTNDMKMFAIADEAVAVENAVPALKAMAHKMIGGNDHDSVARFIYDHRNGH